MVRMDDLYTARPSPGGKRKAAANKNPHSRILRRLRPAVPPGTVYFALPQRMPILTIQLYRLKAEYWVGAQSWVGARDQYLWVPRPWVLQRPGFSEILTAVEFSF